MIKSIIFIAQGLTLLSILVFYSLHSINYIYGDTYQKAIVKSEFALIYARPDFSTPMGRISMGKTVKVGRVKRSLGNFLAIPISGKIMYIPVKDLHLELEQHFNRRNDNTFNRRDYDLY